MAHALLNVLERAFLVPRKILKKAWFGFERRRAMLGTIAVILLIMLLFGLVLFLLGWLSDRRVG
jgi:hypothetical protein